MNKNENITKVIATVLALFGLLTLFLSSSVIFDWFSIRDKQGNYILFIVWANFIAGIFYLISVYGFIKRKKWTFWMLIAAFVILIVAFVALQFHINNGGIHEVKTIKAMIFRIIVTATFSLLAFFYLKKRG